MEKSVGTTHPFASMRDSVTAQISKDSCCNRPYLYRGNQRNRSCERLVRTRVVLSALSKCTVVSPISLVRVDEIERSKLSLLLELVVANIRQTIAGVETYEGTPNYLAKCRHSFRCQCQHNSPIAFIFGDRGIESFPREYWRHC